MEKQVVVAPVGTNRNALYIGIRDIPTKKLILLTPSEKRKLAEKYKGDIEKFHILVKIVEVQGNNLWEAMFGKVAELKGVEGENIIINTSAGDRSTQCALTSAAFVNGLKAFAVEGNETMMLPILRFSYYKLLTDKKLAILRLLYEKGYCASLQELSKLVKMSLPLLSYHINGTREAEGLKDLGLIEVEQREGRIAVKLATMGQLLIKGYVK